MGKVNDNTTAQRHRRVRRQHTDELAQDYVEAVYRRVRSNGAARVMELAADFGVTHVTVIRALRRFETAGLLIYDRESGASLTEEGERKARAAVERHDLLVQFFRSLGVSEWQANADAEGAEHHLSAETFAAIRRRLAADT